MTATEFVEKANKLFELAAEDFKKSNFNYYGWLGYCASLGWKRD
jgi:hypothetical protein